MTDLPSIDAEISVDKMQVIWEKCFREEVCVKIPFDGKQCVSASGCVRILQEGGIYKIEIELFGSRKKFDLLDQCITGFSIGIASLKVCISKLRIVDGSLKGVRIEARLCIGAKIGPINIEKCWDVIGTDINFFYFDEVDKIAPNTAGRALLTAAFDSALMNGLDFVFVESQETCSCS